MRGKVQAAAALAAALRDLPGIEIELVDEQSDHTRIVVGTAGHRYTLSVIWVGNGWPSEVRKALARLKESVPPSFVFTAKQFSPGATSILQEHKVNWADEAGQARIMLSPGLLIVRDSVPTREEETPQTVRWYPSAIQIAERILHEQMRELHTGRLADQTGWSAGQVSKILKMFDSLGWTQRQGGKSGRATRRELIAPGPLLDAWTSHVRQGRRRKKLGHVSSRDLLRFAHTQLWDLLGRDRSDWALTTWAGLEMTTPFATTVPILHIYVSARLFSGRLKETMRAAGIREVEEGARVEFWETDFPILIQPGQPSEIPVISRPRLYADLLALGGRAAEAAEHYRETALGI